MTGSCKIKQDQEAKVADHIRLALVQFFKCLLIVSSVFVLVLVRRGMRDSLNLGKVIAYVLLACLALVVIFLADKFVYNNLLVGLGAYLGFELLRLG